MIRRLFVLALLASPGARAACTERTLTPGWLWNYEGTVGDHRVRLTLTLEDGALSGVYFYATQLKDIRLAGSISNGDHLTLNELDAAGRITARFEGEFPERDPRGKLSGALTCDVITGFWQRVSGSNTSQPGTRAGVVSAAKSLPLFLEMTDGTSGTLSHRYSPAGASDDAPIDRNALRFWRAVAANDRATVASLIRYPIRARIGGASTAIPDPAALISHYDAIFSPAFRAAIAAALPRNMFVRDQGVMLGHGEVWFGSDGRVITLNNF